MTNAFRVLVFIAFAAMGALVLSVRYVRPHGASPISLARPPASVASAVATDRAALKVEIERRWPEISAWGEALEREHSEIEAEDRALDALWYRINSRRRQYPDGMTPAAHADDELDILDYNHRLTVLKTRITSYNGQVVEYRRAVAEFDRLRDQYDSH